jgi:glycosyltransferase involved in cell wall biosynthesis
VPAADPGSAAESGLRLQLRNHSPNAWLSEELPIRNRRQRRDRRHLLLVAPWMTLGGADKYNLDLLDQLARHGWSATVATTLDGRHDWYRQYERLTSDLFPLPHFLPLIDYPRFLHYLVASRLPDVVLVSNSELGYRLLPYLRGTCPSTTLVDFCHSEIDDWNNGGYPRFSIEYQESLDLTITASDHLRSWMIERGGRPERIEVSRANIDTGTWRPLPAARGDLRRELGLAEDEPIVLFAGRLAGEKQPEVLAETFALLAGTGARFTGIVAGEGPDRRWLEAFVRNRGLQDRVRLLGALAPDRMLRLTAGSDIMFVPSKVEGIALTFYEALACGIPVVGARVGGQAELVTDEVGVLIERSSPEDEALRYAEVLASLLADPGRRRSMGLAARTLVETSFPLERMGERMNGLLDRAIELHSSAPGPVPSRQLARATATEAVELMRVAEMADWLSGRLATGGLRSVGTAMYFTLRRIGAPLYVRSVRRGSRLVPRLKSIAQRLLVGGPP